MFFKGAAPPGFCRRCAVFIACMASWEDVFLFLPDCTLIVQDKNGVSL
ncbi:hypothetical protein FAEPRAA2165_03010 [Faecalibacterium duncaniae]|uniref:Uncharacterized protein n=1 Tax=Faecalibacterium duncaniae (strain DSM 17677 / JCM 31915 / A2-165) TaxID=411483 RepID=C7H9K8_FAED2|nr:hypothetical protein FAEPRAA2165_03010 [Faecalibacterium duncaniae]